MVALVGAVGGFHLPQQRVHLVDGEPPVGAHRAVAGHGAQDLIARALHHGAGVVRGQFGQHAARQLHRVALRQRGGHGAHGQGAWREGRNLQAQHFQRFGLGFCGGDFFGRGGEGGRDQQRLAGDARSAVHLGLEAFIDDAFVRGVHVHHDQSLGVLGQDIDAVDLCDGAAQWPGGGLGGGCLFPLGRGRCGGRAPGQRGRRGGRLGAGWGRGVGQGRGGCWHEARLRREAGTEGCGRWRGRAPECLQVGHLVTRSFIELDSALRLRIGRCGAIRH